MSWPVAPEMPAWTPASVAAFSVAPSAAARPAMYATAFARLYPVVLAIQDVRGLSIIAPANEATAAGPAATNAAVRESSSEAPSRRDSE